METMYIGTATHTAAGEPRGFIDCASLRRFWVHTGTACNLRCPNCFEQSAPGDTRIQAICLVEAAPFLDEAARLGVGLFGFTGGEPFVNPDFVPILEYSLRLAPCLVLSNGSEPLRRHLEQLRALQTGVAGGRLKALTIRISLDSPHRDKHDAERGPGRFDMALESLHLLHQAGITIAVARRSEDGEDAAATTAAYKELFAKNGLPADVPLVSFPNLRNETKTPEISESCIRTYHTPETCAGFMCAHSRMLVKQDNRMKLYACTLVDDDPAYDFGSDLTTATSTRTLLRHKRCFSCFAAGVSCAG